MHSLSALVSRAIVYFSHPEGLGHILNDSELVGLTPMSIWQSQLAALQILSSPYQHAPNDAQGDAEHLAGGLSRDDRPTRNKKH